MRKTGCIITVIVAVLSAVIVHADAQPPLAVTGEVENPLALSLGDLSRFESDVIRLNDVRSDGSFRGAFWYEGPPLMTLLEIAGVRKKRAEFTKPIDLAIVATNQKGESVSFSWGEIFYGNPARVIVAVEGNPIMPHFSCGKCHEGDDYKRYYEPLLRQVEFPKLVVEGDYYSDRCLEGITSIRVVDLASTSPPGKAGIGKDDMLFAPGFRIDGDVDRPLSLTDTGGEPRLDMRVKMIGDGKGYHGLSTVSGVPLTRLLEKAGIRNRADIVILISAPDGYRSLLSYGELFLSPSGERIIVSDERDGRPLAEGGKFSIVIPADYSIDRWVKSVDHIEVLSPLPR